VTSSIAVLLATYCMAALGFVPHTVFWVDYIVRGLGHGIRSGAHYWILLGVTAALGPLLAGRTADRIGFRQSLRWALLAEAVGLALPLGSTATAALALSSMAVGGMAMAVSSLVSGRVSELVSIEQQKQVWGWMTMAFAVVYAAGGWAFWYLFARTESYRLLFVPGAGALAMGAALDWLSEATFDAAVEGEERAA
jgi:predicted MFS family arabinose efflux permease